MQAQEPIRLRRDCEAIEVPSGNKITLKEGTEVRIMQTMGGNFTVTSLEGGMAQIMGMHADALGKEIPKEAHAPSGQEGSLEDLVWAQMKKCYDPEIPVNVVDLGLIYECQISDTDEGGAKRVSVKMTVTAPGCGMGPAIASQVQSSILSVPGVKEADVELVWDPPWDRDKMSEAAKLQLGMM